MNHWQNMDVADITGEIWMDVNGFEGLYMVSNYGRVKSLPNTTGTNKGGRRKVQIIRKQFVHPTGYLIIQLCNNKRNFPCKSHRIVATAFLPNPQNKREVNHIDGDKENNNIDNLEWSTRSEQLLHMYRVLGQKGALTGRFGKNHPNFGKTGAQNKRSRPTLCVTTGKTYESATEAALDMGLHPLSVALAARKPESSLHSYKFQYL